ncbi:HtaA domain-containing protein [Streptomyces sp. NPDC055013]
MARRPGAVAVTGGALLALLCPGAATAQDGDVAARTVSGGYASWSTAAAELADLGVRLDVAEPAVRGGPERAWFPATGGGTDPDGADAAIDLGGTARLTGAAPSLTLAGLRLDLAGDTGTLSARTALRGEARELALADLTTGAEPVVRASGVTWTGLRASLTPDGAALLAEWSGVRFAAGDALGVLDVTVGTAGAQEGGETPQPTPTPTPYPSEEKQSEEKQGEQQEENPATGDPTRPAAPTATVSHPELTAGTEQHVTGAGFEPGEVVLVAIDEDTRYQAVADGTGRIARTFPVYATATEGAHTVELSTVTGKHRAVVEFGVRVAS